ncbi:MAG: hypothetical protein ABS81_29030 [Pseudonocardia sp. SCN 72-86]|nr:MAG: hypothetical protein ABS81_29030 [Pseudonocardia sp. SCN 72-86]
MLLALPQMYGVGHPVLERGIVGGYAVGFLLVLLVGKMLATSLTIGIGGSGGVFAPSLFVGAMLGTALGDVLIVFELTGEYSITPECRRTAPCSSWPRRSGGWTTVMC